MPRHPHQCAVKVAVVLAGLATSSIAHGQIYKCVDGGGQTAYSSAPCDAQSKPLQLPNDTKQSATTTSVCAQLLDERSRLAAEAQRNAKRGNAENTHNAKRQQALAKQYEARCVGIARSRSMPK